MLIAGIFCEWVAPYDPLAIDFASLLAALSWEIYGSRTALVIGFTSSFVDAVGQRR